MSCWGLVISGTELEFKGRSLMMIPMKWEIRRIYSFKEVKTEQFGFEIMVKFEDISKYHFQYFKLDLSFGMEILMKNLHFTWLKQLECIQWDFQSKEFNQILSKISHFEYLHIYEVVQWDLFNPKILTRIDHYKISDPIKSDSLKDLLSRVKSIGKLEFENIFDNSH